MYRSLMYRGMDACKRRRTPLRGIVFLPKVASICLIATSMEVAMSSIVTSIKHQFVAMDRLAVILRQAYCWREQCYQYPRIQRIAL